MFLFPNTLIVLIVFLQDLSEVWAPGTPVYACRSRARALLLYRASQLLYWLIHLRGCVWICLYAATAAGTYCQDRGKPGEELNCLSLEREVSRFLDELTATAFSPIHMEFGGDGAVARQTDT